jgi:hypothetical protein
MPQKDSGQNRSRKNNRDTCSPSQISAYAVHPNIRFIIPKYFDRNDYA